MLLGEKLTGIGQGKLVAPGGKREGREVPAETAVREIREEVGLVVQKDALAHIATIRYPFPGREEMSQRSFAFLTRKFVGEPVPSGELVASWWPLEGVPFHRMWADAALWLPRAIQGEFIQATIEIGYDNEVLNATFMT